MTAGDIFGFVLGRGADRGRRSKCACAAPMLWSPFSFARASRALEKGDHNMGTACARLGIRLHLSHVGTNAQRAALRAAGQATSGKLAFALPVTLHGPDARRFGFDSEGCSHDADEIHVLCKFLSVKPLILSCRLITYWPARSIFISGAHRPSNIVKPASLRAPYGTLHTLCERGVLSEFRAARARASYWFDNHY